MITQNRQKVKGICWGNLRFLFLESIVYSISRKFDKAYRLCRDRDVSTNQSLALWEWPRPASLDASHQFTFRWRRSRRRGFYSKTCFLTLSPATAGALPKGEPYTREPYFRLVRDVCTKSVGTGVLDGPQKTITFPKFSARSRC